MQPDEEVYSIGSSSATEVEMSRPCQTAMQMTIELHSSSM